MHGSDDLVAGFNEGGGAVGGTGSQQGFAVIVTFLRQSPVTRHDVESGEPAVQQFAQVAAGGQSAGRYETNAEQLRAFLFYFLQDFGQALTSWADFHFIARRIE